MAAQAEDFASLRNTPAWLLVFFNNLFCGCAGFSIVLPTLWPYLRQMHSNTFFLAFVVAAYSVGEGLGGLVVGRLYTRHLAHPKALLLGNMVIGFGAALVFSLAPLFGDRYGPIVVLVCRFLSGFDNGGRQTIEQTFVGQFVPKQHLTTVGSRLGSCAVTGIMLGPAFGAPLQAIRFTVPGLGLFIDGNNAPGLVLCVACLINIFITAKYFNPHASGHVPSHHADLTSDTTTPINLGPKPLPLGVFTCYAAFFAVNLFMASVETITPVVCQRLLGWGPCEDSSTCAYEPSQTYVNVLMTTGGLMSLLMSLIMAFWLGAKVFGSEELVICVSLLVYVASNLMNMDWFGTLPAWRFVASYLLSTFLGGMMRGPSVALLSQIVGDHPQGPYMGTLFAVGALPRIVGPLIFVQLLDWPAPLSDADFPNVYDGPLPRTWLLYGSQVVIFAAILPLLLATRGPIRAHLAQAREHSSPGAVPNALRTPLLDHQETDVVAVV
mmetsp:Transcript_17732/g.49121  ORF Transcript_17732/g.49121 Transcript_17732/m.49121 type:complete len:494 (-) Transcript_17732:219-1700(-)